MMMMMIRSQENLRRNKSIGISDDHIIPTSTCPTWKLYENPFYNSQNPLQQDSTPPLRIQHNNNKQIHRLNLPISARKIAASFWDLTFIRPFMDSELEIARAQVAELKAKVEHERKARKKLEWMNKKIARELSEEKKALERVCEELANHISSDKAEMNRLRKDMEEERKMLRVVEFMREERVQMKLTEAKYLLEDKLLELEATKKMLQTEQSIQENNYNTSSAETETNSISEGNSSTCNFQVTIHRRNHSQEAENPHIKRGIKGFVEFPKVVRAISSKSKHWGTKLECQKAQLRILLKQKCPIPSNAHLTTSK